MSTAADEPAVMRLARVHGPGDVRIDRVPVPSPGPGEVIVRVAACGICGSDLGYIAQGSLGGVEPLREPLAIGHELAGTVAAVGPGVDGIAIGLRVAVNPDRAFIGGGGPDGGMADYLRVSAAKLGDTLFALPEGLSFAAAALAEPLSVALHALRVARVGPADRVAVLGAGPIGLSAVIMLRHLGVQDVVIFDRVAERLDRARALGAAAAIDVGEEPAPAALARLHGAGERFGAPWVGTDVFVDCAGSGAALAELLGIAKYRARVAVVALHHRPLELDLFRLMANEITIAGSIADNRPVEFGEAIAMLGERAIDLAPLISHRYDFGRFDEALATARDPARAAKVMLTFDMAA
ncbi:zinc-dependent alcohol dehydrogenase [Novosphingobium aerophilum]|nr:zinc-binding dehydrogenase [Novosphingobium aerophilum]